MIMHVLGLLYTFILTAIFSAGVALSPLAVSWGSFWVYLTFAIWIIPGYILAWLTIMATIGILALLGMGALFGVSLSADALSKRINKKTNTRAGRNLH